MNFTITIIILWFNQFMNIILYPHGANDVFDGKNDSAHGIIIYEHNQKFKDGSCVFRNGIRGRCTRFNWESSNLWKFTGSREVAKRFSLDVEPFYQAENKEDLVVIYKTASDYGKLRRHESLSELKVWDAGE